MRYTMGENYIRYIQPNMRLHTDTTFKMELGFNYDMFLCHFNDEITRRIFATKYAMREI